MSVIVAVAALVAFVNAVVIPEAGSWFLDAVVKMPKFDYKFQNGEQGNDNWVMYRNLRTVAFLIIAVALTYAVIILIGEEFEVYRKGEAFAMLSKGLLIIVFIFTFPPIWDLFASGMEGLAKYVLNPSNPNQANRPISTLVQMIGGIVPPNFDWTTIINGLTDPNSFQGFFRDVFLAVFKAFIAALLMFLMFVIGTVRIVLTGVLAIALPIILAFSIVPYLSRVMDRLKDILIGLSLAPLLSALSVSAGLALINSTNFSPLQEWLAAIAVALLAVTFPVITAPVLGSLVSTASTIFTGGMLAGTLFGGSAVAGVATGAYRGIQAAMQTGVMSPLGIARAALTGAGSGLYTGLQTGTVTSALEAAKSMGFARLAEPLHRAEQVAVRRLREAGLETAHQIIDNYTGSYVEGLLPKLALEIRYSNEDIQNAIKYANRVKASASRGEYSKITDEFTNMTGIAIHDKERFGKMYAEQIEAYSKNPEALASIYRGLQNYKNKPLDADDVSSTIATRDMTRTLASGKFGIDIPNPEFEVLDKKHGVPSEVELAYNLKLGIGHELDDIARGITDTNVKAVDTHYTLGDFYEGIENRQRLLDELRSEIISSFGDEPKNENFVRQFADSVISDLSKYDNYTLAGLKDKIKDIAEKGLKEHRKHITRELFEKADKMLPNVHIRELLKDTESKSQ
ncbi:hypothetical protein [Candidatus Nitrosocaldus islandicus]|uniref:hypothetical protein n=1 Tax=Candidatus Nitrosocaldus islandicus TaxID=2045011 RepID=UPI000CD31CAC|nr:hypothetical protein [Candidatus Nitrosocaldus islandicus]